MQGVPRVANRAPAPIQVTAEQLLREAGERALEEAPKKPRSVITDPIELEMERVRRRKDFEDRIRKDRSNMTNWLNYAKYEEQQGDFRRCRSVFERALDIDYTRPHVWVRYAEMEARHKHINSARNVWDRAVGLLPRVDQLWLKYAYMEEMLGRAAAARAIFEKWMAWEPPEAAWFAFIKFEDRQQKTAAAPGSATRRDRSRVRLLYERYCGVHPSARAYVKYAKWECRGGGAEGRARARVVYERAMEELQEAEKTERLYMCFAEFEEICKEYARSRAIYKYGLDCFAFHEGDASEQHALGGGHDAHVSDLPRGSALYRAYVSFEKRYGAAQEIDDAITLRRRSEYERLVKANRLDYDAWLDFARLEEAVVRRKMKKFRSDASSEAPRAVLGAQEGWFDRVRGVYDRAVACTPPTTVDKRFWRRYIYFWVYYAVFEEVVACDVVRTRAVYQRCLRVVPHARFTFAKLWIMFAHFEVRCLDIGAARKVLGQALGRCPKEKLFKSYIHLEVQLGEITRCRALYERFVQFMPSNANAWAAWAQLEHTWHEYERARAIFRLAVGQPDLDAPELVWKKFIDFEIAVAGVAGNVPPQGDGASVPPDGFGRARALYEELLTLTQHVKVWASYAQFELAYGRSPANAYKVFERAEQVVQGVAEKADIATLKAQLATAVAQSGVAAGVGDSGPLHSSSSGNERTTNNDLQGLLERARQWKAGRE